MVVYSFYVFDRHCTCVYYANFAGKGPRAGPSTLPNVYRPALTASIPPPPPIRRDSVRDSVATSSDRSSLSPWERSSVSGSILVAQGDAPRDEGGSREGGEARAGLAFDEEAKLVYGIIFSLRNMVKKLAGRDDDSFHSFSTSAYKLHYLYTSTSNHFVLVTSPMSESLRFLLRQIYTGPYTEFVTRNPMVGMDSRESGKGIDNDGFRLAVEKLLAI